MANLSIEVASIAEREATGYQGAVICVSRGITYRIGVLKSGSIIDPSRNGESTSIGKWPANVIKNLAKTAAIYFPPSN